MFDHVRGDRLDQHKYPWISLTQAAIYLMSPDDVERQRAINSDDWARPFRKLAEWIESGRLTVYDGWEPPYKTIPKEEFFDVPFKYPSYPESRGGRAYQIGVRTFIECNLSPPRDRYFQSRKSEPKWRDLKIQSQQLVALFEAENIEAFNEIAATLVPADQHEDRPQKAKPGPKPEFEWGRIETKCYDLMDHHGDFMPDDRDWDCQARLETELMKFCQETWGREPGASTLREKLPEWLSAWHKRKTGAA
jgi:hypothetical protein